jgi:Flp pilus assembly protein TadD
LEQRLREDPMDTLAIVRLARLLESSKEVEQAARYYRRLVTINRASRQGWIGLASVYETLENWNAAEEAITSLLAVAPGDAEAMYLLGSIHANRGDLAAARTWWRRVERQATDPQQAERTAQSLRRLSGLPS